MCNISHGCSLCLVISVLFGFIQSQSTMVQLQGNLLGSFFAMEELPAVNRLLSMQTIGNVPVLFEYQLERENYAFVYSWDASSLELIQGYMDSEAIVTVEGYWRRLEEYEMGMRSMRRSGESHPVKYSWVVFVVVRILDVQNDWKGVLSQDGGFELDIGGLCINESMISWVETFSTKSGLEKVDVKGNVLDTFIPESYRSFPGVALRMTSVIDAITFQVPVDHEDLAAQVDKFQQLSQSYNARIVDFFFESFSFKHRIQKLDN